MAIPDHAKKVYEGTIFTVYQWDQPLYDGSTAVFEAIRRPSEAQVIPTIGDQILLSWEEQPSKPLTYGLFGGRVEPGEEPLAAVQREFLEETGMEAENWELFNTYQIASKIESTNYIYFARNARKIAEPRLEAGERIETRLVSFEEFIRIATHEPFWTNRDFIIELFRIKEDPQKLAEFKARLFGR